MSWLNAPTYAGPWFDLAGFIQALVPLLEAGAPWLAVAFLAATAGFIVAVGQRDTWEQKYLDQRAEVWCLDRRVHILEKKLRQVSALLPDPKWRGL